MELVRLDYGPMCRNDSCMYGCKVAFLMYILIPFCRKCGWLCIFHEEFCEKDKFAYHIVDILRNLLFFMVYLLWTVFSIDLYNVSIEDDAIDMPNRHCEVTLQQQDHQSYSSQGKGNDQKKVHI